MKKRILLLTGVPGVGKTTVLLKSIEVLKTMGHSVGGMISREVRSCGTRVGFEILDLESGRRGWLAHVNQKIGPQVGKYRVNLEDLDAVGVEAILKAVEKCDVVAIDEVGPMELFSKKFRAAVRKTVESDKLVVGVMHWKARDRLIEELRTREDSEIYTITQENRNKIHEIIAEKAIGYLKSR
ncbi:MAG: NTPase [Candidatus Bathycorpusculaceae bacterium]